MSETNLTYKCWESKGGEWGMKCGKRIPKLVTKGGTKRVIGRKILEACPYIGSYGMGGAGFLGFKLEAKGRYKEEWLVLTMWGADEWVLLNGLWLDCHSNLRKTHLDKCYFKTDLSFFDDRQKQIDGTFIGKTITSFVIRNKSFKMMISSDGGDYVLELPADLSKLPPYGNGNPRNWNKDEKMIDGFLISHTEYINI